MQKAPESCRSSEPLNLHHDVVEQPAKRAKTTGSEACYGRVLAISYQALKRARHTIEDFVQSYFPYHGLDSLKDFLRWWDILVFVEGTIYQLDEDNEQLASEGRIEKVVPCPSEKALVSVLKQRSLWTGEVQEEFEEGLKYWENERRLCAIMLSKSQIPASGHQPGFSLEEVHETSLGKSFDYRLLNLVLYALRRQPPDPLLLEFLRVDEHLVDIGDDLVDYEGDVVKNSFNIFRAYVHLYGRAAPLKLAERISEYEARHVQLLVGLPQQLQQHFRRRQHEAAGSDAALRWSFPQPIFDEGRFREEHAGDSSSDESSQ